MIIDDGGGSCIYFIPWKFIFSHWRRALVPSPSLFRNLVHKLRDCDSDEHFCWTHDQTIMMGRDRIVSQILYLSLYLLSWIDRNDATLHDLYREKLKGTSGSNAAASLLAQVSASFQYSYLAWISNNYKLNIYSFLFLKTYLIIQILTNPFSTDGAQVSEGCRIHSQLYTKELKNLSPWALNSK